MEPCTQDSDCFSGRCAQNLYCSKQCVAHQDCGVGEGGQNLCLETNGGDFLCFPGCTTDEYICSDFDPDWQCLPIDATFEDWACG